MGTEPLERKLAAILYADVAGYSRLTGEDEDATHRTLSGYLDLLTKTIEAHRGQVMHYAGDAVLAKFDAVVGAMSAAVAIQKELATRNQGLPDNRRVQFRIGVNLGDVIEDRGDIYGDGVNVAARLESLADPGGICISEAVRTAVGKKLGFDYEDMGAQEVKNIEDPVRAYRVALGDKDALAMRTPDQPSLELPDKPSIAVLPFVNMSADAEQEFFSDGITEDIIAQLSKFRSLFVIARNSSFAFKGQQLEIKEIGRRLGVRYVVEGSVRRAGKRLRITAQLIDAVHDRHLWAERYERDLEDIFAVQDEVTTAIVTSIEPELASAERQRARRKLPGSLDAWECYQRGLWHLYQYKAEDTAKSQEFFSRAIEVDPNFGAAQAALGYALYYEVIEGFASAHDDRMSRALEAAKLAVVLDERDDFAQMVLGRVLLAHGEFEASIAACQVALKFNPNNANAHYGEGLSLCFAGHPEAAIPKVEEALRLSPQDPGAWAFMWLMSHALTLSQSYDEALVWAQKAVHEPNATVWAFATEAAVFAYLDRTGEARAAVDRALAIKPDLSTNFFSTVLPWKDRAQLEHYLDGLRKAGLPN